MSHSANQLPEIAPTCSPIRLPAQRRTYGLSRKEKKGPFRGKGKKTQKKKLLILSLLLYPVRRRPRYKRRQDRSLSLMGGICNAEKKKTLSQKGVETSHTAEGKTREGGSYP